MDFSLTPFAELRSGIWRALAQPAAVNVVLIALGQQPYVKVFEVIDKIREQAVAQSIQPTEEEPK